MIIIRDEEIVQKAIDEMPLPEQVERVITEYGNDWAGDPALFVWVIYRDEVTQDRAAFYAMDDQLRARIREVVARTGSDRWPYVQLRLSSEHAEIEQETRRAVKA